MLRDPLDGNEVLSGGEDDGFDGVETGLDELLDVVGVYARLLELVY